MRAGAIDIRIEGDEALLEALASIDQPHLDKLLRDTMAAGAAKMKPAVAAAAPKWKASSGTEGGSQKKPTHPGDLPASISMKRGKASRPPAAIVYPKRKKGGWISHFIVGGTKPHSLARRGSITARAYGWGVQRRGFSHPGTSPNPYITRGGKAGTPAALAEIKKRIAAYWNTLG
jgi:hypothetical protein